MKFVIEKGEIDFGVTIIDNIFIEDYMPIAKGSFVKVYLYAYKNMSSNTNFEITNERLAKNLKLNVRDVEDAWDYWESEGVIEKVFKVDGDFDIEFKDLKKYYVENGLKLNPRRKLTPQETLINAMENNITRQMFNNVDYYMRRQTTPMEKLEIVSWISDFNMSPQLIEVAFEFSTEKKKKISINYVKAIVKSWYDNKISTVEQVEKELEKIDKRYIRKTQVLRKLGLQNRSVSEPEIDLINSWYDKYDFTKEMIDLAISKSSSASRPSIKYVDAILQNWKRAGVENIEDIAKKDPRVKKVPKKTKFHNYKGQSDNLTESELNDIANQMMRKRRDIKGE